MSRKITIELDEEELRKMQKGVLREQFKKDGVFYAWKRPSQKMKNKKAIKNKKACRKKVEQE